MSLETLFNLNCWSIQSVVLLPLDWFRWSNTILSGWRATSKSLRFETIRTEMTSRLLKLRLSPHIYSKKRKVHSLLRGLLRYITMKKAFLNRGPVLLIWKNKNKTKTNREPEGTTASAFIPNTIRTSHAFRERKEKKQTNKDERIIRRLKATTSSSPSVMPLKY